MPTRSPRSLSINADISCLARVSRFGLMSSANMLSEVSSAKTKSIPSALTGTACVPICGRATAMARHVSASRIIMIFAFCRQRLTLRDSLATSSRLPKRSAPRRRARAACQNISANAGINHNTCKYSGVANRIKYYGSPALRRGLSCRFPRRSAGLP